MIGSAIARTHAERALHESENKLRLILDSTAEAIYGVDLDGRCTFCNTACLRTLGYERSDELLGRNMHYLAHQTGGEETIFPSEGVEFAGLPTIWQFRCPPILLFVSFGSYKKPCTIRQNTVGYGYSKCNCGVRHMKFISRLATPGRALTSKRRERAADLALSEWRNG